MRAALLALLLPAGLAAQRPAVSPALPRVWDRDTTVAVWLFLRPATDLAQGAARAAAAGARVRVRSRWLHALSAEVPTAALRTLARDPAYRRIQPLGRFRTPRGSPFPSDTIPRLALADTCGPAGHPVYGPSEMPFRRLYLLALSDRGVDGAGVRVALFDTGFDTANPAFGGITIAAQHDFVFDDSVVRDEPADLAGAQFHGTATWSLLAADVPGRLRGIARGATYLLAKTEDIRSETRVEEDHYVAALEWADSIGVDVVSTSLGYLQFDNGFGYSPSQLNGDVAVTTVAVDLAAERDILVVTAAGNAGPGFRTLGTPADADSGVTAGAEDSLGAIAGFSSRGPTADGRLKPDFTAPGVAVCVVVGAGPALGRLNGTSIATPLLAAAATLVKQLHPALGPIALRDALRRHALNRAQPDSTRGWGRPNTAASAVFPLGIVPVAPLPGTLTTVTPTFAWSPGNLSGFAGPVVYRLRVARDSALTALLADTIVTGATTVDLARALRPGPVFWRVDATAASGQTATTGSVDGVVPAWATLTVLNDPAGTTITDSQPTFTWSSPAIASPPGPFRYGLFVRRPGSPVPVVAAGLLTGTSFTLPQPLERNTPYTWSVVAHAGGDTSETTSAGTFLVLDPTLPAATLLYQNFPNPFPGNGRDATCLWFDLAIASLVEFEVLDLRGNLVRRFVPSRDFPTVLPPGRYGRGAAGGPTCDPRLTWDGRADDGRQVPAGVYLSRLKAGGTVTFKRIVFVGRD